MAEQEQEPKPILPKDSDGEEEEESEGMQTVDLGRKPVLTFQQSPDRPVRTTVGQPPPRQNGSQHGSGATNGEHQAMGGTQLQQRSRVLAGNAASFKEWGSQQYKVTKQILSERFGKGLRTVDPDLERRIAAIYDTQRKYNQLTALSGQLQSHLSAVIETQKSLAEHFAFLSVRAPELNLEFESNAELQKKISHNGEALVGAVKFFISNVHTVTAKSIEDTLATAKNYETARILYDAYRADYESITKAATTSQVCVYGGVEWSGPRATQHSGKPIQIEWQSQ